MNKKLFSWKALAGVALLAAVSFTSCQADKAIDSSNPSGVAPTTVAHQVGGDYDWTATVTSNAQLMEFFNADKAKIQELADKNKTKFSVCINLNNYALDGKEFILPNPWGTADAKDKVINITVNGTFKNADFERADAIKNGAKATKFPVVLNTNNLGGAEVNFTLADQKFDLDLKSELTRSTFAGEYTIGWFKVAAQNDLSATEIKSGTVEAIDYESTGDVKGEIAAIWTKNAGTTINNISANGVKIGQYLAANNIFVEENATITNAYAVPGGTKYAQLGTVTFKKAATVTLGTKAIAIEKILGTKAADCVVNIDKVDDPLKNVAALEKVTIKSKAVELTNDKFTDVIFKSPVTISTDKINTIENVTFNGLTIKVPADDQTITFNGVSFNNAVTMQSTMEVENTTETVEYFYYQWIIDKTLANGGKYEEYDDAKKITEANKGKEEKEYSSETYQVVGGELQVKVDGKWKAADMEAYLIKIKKVNKAGKVVIKPENCKVVMDKDCKFWDADLAKPALATTDKALNDIWGNKGKVGAATSDPNAEEVAWYAVNYNEADYKWVPSYDKATGKFQYYILIKKATAAAE